MKTAILRRLEALEQATNACATPPLRIVDVTQLPDDDRVAYWSGDDDVLNRYASPVLDMPPGTITTIIVSVNAESRAIWEAARTMTDEEFDAWDDDQIRENERDGVGLTTNNNEDTTTASPFGIWGWDRNGLPIYVSESAP